MRSEGLWMRGGALMRLSTSPAPPQMLERGYRDRASTCVASAHQPPMTFGVRQVGGVGLGLRCGGWGPGSAAAPRRPGGLRPSLGVRGGGGGPPARQIAKKLWPDARPRPPPLAFQAVFEFERHMPRWSWVRCEDPKQIPFHVPGPSTSCSALRSTSAGRARKTSPPRSFRD